MMVHVACWVSQIVFLRPTFVFTAICDRVLFLICSKDMEYLTVVHLSSLASLRRFDWLLRAVYFPFKPSACSGFHVKKLEPRAFASPTSRHVARKSARRAVA